MKKHAKEIHHPLFPLTTPAEELAEAMLLERARLWRVDLLPLLLDMASSQEELHNADFKSICRWMKNDPAYQSLGRFAKETQDELWQIESGIVERQSERIAELVSKTPDVGSLSLWKDFKIPADQKVCDIHRMPGGYSGEKSQNDTFAGALYDRGVYIYSGKRWGSRNDLFGKTLIENLLPFLRKRGAIEILDMGCSVGHSTLPYVDAFPEATIHALDVAAPMLRYAHARAAYLNKWVNFWQADATETEFEDESFDLIVSHILFHEMPVAKIGKLFKEIHRLLKPGGMMAHIDLRPYRAVRNYSALTPMQCFAANLDTWHNNEPYWQAVRSANLLELASRHFEKERLIETLVAPAGTTPLRPERMWYFLAGVKGS